MFSATMAISAMFLFCKLDSIAFYKCKTQEVIQNSMLKDALTYARYKLSMVELQTFRMLLWQHLYWHLPDTRFVEVQHHSLEKNLPYICATKTHYSLESMLSK